MSTFHKVANRDELQIVNKWLEQQLPQSFGAFNFTRAVLAGRWTGEAIYTLGWPSIRAVVTGGLEPGHPAPEHYLDHNPGLIYATNDTDIDFLLHHDSVMDWSKPFFKRALPERIAKSLEKIARERGVIDKFHFFMAYTFHVKPENMKKRTVPDGYSIRAIKSEPSEIDYCMSTWKHSITNSVQGLRAWVERFPSVCLVNSDDQIVSFEVGNDIGALALLHTREEARGRGFASIVTSHLVEEMGKLNWDSYACIAVDNETSCSFHKSLGFTELDGKFGFFGYNP